MSRSSRTHSIAWESWMSQQRTRSRILIKSVQIGWALVAAALVGLNGCNKSAPKPPSTNTAATRPAEPAEVQAAAPEADALLSKVLSAIVAEEGLVHYERLEEA